MRWVGPPRIRTLPRRRRPRRRSPRRRSRNMADPRFFAVAGPFTLSELAELTGSEIAGAADRRLVLRDVAPIDSAGPDCIAFLDNRKYADTFARSKAGAAFVHPHLAAKAPPGMTLLLSEKPYKAYALAAQAFYPQPSLRPGIAATALVDPSARIGEGCEIAAHVVIGAGVEIGDDCRIGANTVIDDG